MIPCSWDVVTPACAQWEGYPQATKDAALWLASTFLWGATGRQYGACPVTVRPAQSRFNPVNYRAYPVLPGSEAAVGGPYLFGGVWRNCGCGAGCCCRPMCSVVLEGPVAAVDEVLVDGEAVSPSIYRVDVVAGQWHLVRLDGTCWPSCQDMNAAEDEPGAFAVTYQLGTELPEALSIVTGVLACEYGKLLATGECALPQKLRRITRQGVEIEVEPPDAQTGDLTGIKVVDDIIGILNPSKRREPPRILSPDLDINCDRRTAIYPGAS